MLKHITRISDRDVFSNIILDKRAKRMYTLIIMIVQNILLASESYTYKNWIHKDVYVSFSRLYYIIDGTAYYEEDGKAILLKKGHLYLTPVKKSFGLYDDPEDRLLHTYCHVTTAPTVERLTEIEVVEGTPLYDAVALWRKYIHTSDTELLKSIIQLLLSLCVKPSAVLSSPAQKVKEYIDTMDTYSLDMTALSRAVGYSREHITRSFVSAYNVTPKQYLNARRMNAARAMLLDGARVMDVSEHIGYANQYSFSKAFRAHFGLSPEKYVRAMK